MKRQRFDELGGEVVEIGVFARLQLQFQLGDGRAALARENFALIESRLDLRAANGQAPNTAFELRFEQRFERVVADRVAHRSGDGLAELVDVKRRAGMAHLNFAAREGALRRGRVPFESDLRRAAAAATQAKRHPLALQIALRGVVIDRLQRLAGWRRS